MQEILEHHKGKLTSGTIMPVKPKFTYRRALEIALLKMCWILHLEIYFFFYRILLFALHCLQVSFLDYCTVLIAYEGLCILLFVHLSWVIHFN